MWDTICNLPLDHDIISLATHPTEPILAIGLASGHVHVYRIPAPNEPVHLHAARCPQQDDPDTQNGTVRRSSLTLPPSSPSPSNGYGCMTTLWETRRHKASCRALQFSPDGTTLFSAGMDGLLKAAHAHSGHVLGKISISINNDPNVLCALSNDTLLLGHDGGADHVYPLSAVSRLMPLSKGDAPTKLTALVPSPSPKTTMHPHASEDDPAASTQPITSITPLPATAGSTSGARRAWISTSGGTLAACDLHRGVVKLSIEQGGAAREELLASACVPTPGGTDLVLTADSAGLLSIFARGAWEDRAAGVRVHTPPQQTPGVAVFASDDGSDNSIDSLATSRSGLLACGLASGAVRFVRLLPEPAAAAKRAAPGSAAAHAAQRTAARKRARLLPDAAQHAEQRLDGVACLAFDVHGRLLSGGGALVKLWGWVDRPLHPISHEDSDDDDARDGDGGSDALEEEDEEDESDADADSDSDAAPARRRKKRRRRDTTKAGKPKRGARGGDHGIAAVRGID